MDAGSIGCSMMDGKVRCGGWDTMFCCADLIGDGGWVVFAFQCPVFEVMELCYGVVGWLVVEVMEVEW